MHEWAFTKRRKTIHTTTLPANPTTINASMPCTILRIGIGFNAILSVKLQRNLAYSACKGILCLKQYRDGRWGENCTAGVVSLDSIYRASAWVPVVLGLVRAKYDQPLNVQCDRGKGCSENITPGRVVLIAALVGCVLLQVDETRVSLGDDVRIYSYVSAVTKWYVSSIVPIEKRIRERYGVYTLPHSP